MADSKNFAQGRNAAHHAKQNENEKNPKKDQKTQNNNKNRSGSNLFFEAFNNTIESFCSANDIEKLSRSAVSALGFLLIALVEESWDVLFGRKKSQEEKPQEKESTQENQISLESDKKDKEEKLEKVLDHIKKNINNSPLVDNSLKKELCDQVEKGVRDLDLKKNPDINQTQAQTASKSVSENTSVKLPEQIQSSMVSDLQRPLAVSLSSNLSKETSEEKKIKLEKQSNDPKFIDLVANTAANFRHGVANKKRQKNNQGVAKA